MSSPWGHQERMRKEADMGGTAGDPWSMDYFAPPSANPVSPYTHKRYVRPVPEVDDLFRIQKRLVMYLQFDDAGDHDSARNNVEMAYRMLVRYLSKYNR